MPLSTPNRAHVILFAQIRLRHPGGVTTLDVDPETTTIGELKMMIFSTAEIQPEEQEGKVHRIHMHTR